MDFLLRELERCQLPKKEQEKVVDDIPHEMKEALCLATKHYHGEVAGKVFEIISKKECISEKYLEELMGLNSEQLHKYINSLKDYRFISVKLQMCLDQNGFPFIKRHYYVNYKNLAGLKKSDVKSLEEKIRNDKRILLATNTNNASNDSTKILSIFTEMTNRQLNLFSDIPRGLRQEGNDELSTLWKAVQQFTSASNRERNSSSLNGMQRPAYTSDSSQTTSVNSRDAILRISNRISDQVSAQNNADWHRISDLLPSHSAEANLTEQAAQSLEPHQNSSYNTGSSRFSAQFFEQIQSASSSQRFSSSNELRQGFFKVRILNVPKGSKMDPSGAYKNKNKNKEKEKENAANTGNENSSSIPELDKNLKKFQNFIASIPNAHFGTALMDPKFKEECEKKAGGLKKF